MKESQPCPFRDVDTTNLLRPRASGPLRLDSLHLPSATCFISGTICAYRGSQTRTSYCLGQRSRDRLLGYSVPPTTNEEIGRVLAEEVMCRRVAPLANLCSTGRVLLSVTSPLATSLTPSDESTAV